MSGLKSKVGIGAALSFIVLLDGTSGARAQFAAECPAFQERGYTSPFERFRQRQFDVAVFFRVFKSGSSTFLGALSNKGPSGYAQKYHATFVDRLDGTRNGEPREWKGWEGLRASCPGDIWLYGHGHSWDLPELATLLQPVQRQRVVYLTMFREPNIWVRSCYSHGWKNRHGQPFLQWLIGSHIEQDSTVGLRKLSRDYLRMFPERLTAPFVDLVHQFRFGAENSTELSSSNGLPRGKQTSRGAATLVPAAAATREMTLTALLSIDYAALECHLRTNVLTLVTEFHNTSLALLGYTLTGSTTALLPSVDVASGAHFKKWEHQSHIPPFILGNLTAQEFVQQSAMFAPVLAPFEAVYGIAIRVFSAAVQEAAAAGAQF